MRRILPALALSALLLIACQASPTPTPDTTQAKTLRLAQSALAEPGYPLHLLPGTATTDIAPRLPVGAEVIGTVVQEGWLGTEIRVVLELPLPPFEAAISVTNALTEAGWSLVFPPVETSSLGPSRVSAILCDGEQTTHYVLAVPAQASGRSEVQIEERQYNQSNQGSQGCGRESSPGPGYDGILPTLKLPFRATWNFAVGMNPKADYWMHTIMSAKEIEQHIAEQLLAAGWQRTGEDSMDTTAWSAWLFTDDQERPWTAALSVTPRQNYNPVATINDFTFTLEALPLGHRWYPPGYPGVP